MKKQTKILLIILGGLLLFTTIMFVLDSGVGRDFDWRLLSI